MFFEDDPVLMESSVKVIAVANLLLGSVSPFRMILRFAFVQMKVLTMRALQFNYLRFTYSDKTKTDMFLYSNFDVTIYYACIIQQLHQHAESFPHTLDPCC